ncbi:GNAT family N-acetyltransferase [Paenibacillus rhizoplanae]
MWRYAAYGVYRLFHSGISKDTIHIDPLVVSGEARGLGIGTRLLEAAFTWSRQANRSKVLLEVVDTNPLAKKLYERVGFRTFKVENTRLFSSQAGFHKVLHMEKMLK